MKALTLRLWRDEQAQDLTEYALLLVLIALAAVASVQTVANAITSIFNSTAANLSTTAGGGAGGGT
jgi:pilus assembly protein Flp/PilA